MVLTGNNIFIRFFENADAGVMLNNSGSMRVLEKAGFHREGIEQKGVRINGEWEDHQIFAIISDNN